MSKEDGFELRGTGRGVEIYNLKVFCPQCKGDVIINRLFPECIFCDHPFEIDWFVVPENLDQSIQNCDPITRRIVEQNHKR